MLTSTPNASGVPNAIGLTPSARRAMRYKPACWPARLQIYLAQNAGTCDVRPEEIGEAFAEFDDGETDPWDTAGIPDNETHFVIRTTVKRNTICRTMKHVLGRIYRTMKHLFRLQVPETTGEFHPPNLLFKVINNNTGRLLFNVKSA